MDRKKHWDRVYSRRAPEDLTWFQNRPDTSLSLIRRTGLASGARIIDVGGGTASLARFLLEQGFKNLGILDVSGRGLELARDRLGRSASEVEWFDADVTTFESPHPWDLWHDRAVFHFFTDAGDRRAYLRAMERAVDPMGHVLIATFAPEGPDRCSGLDCVRYSSESLHAELGPGYELRGSLGELHHPPGGGSQEFVYSWFQKVAGATFRAEPERGHRFPE